MTEIDQPLRVSTLELFFDLVFVFAITQLTGILAGEMTLASGLRVLLIFGALWWMYDAYTWLANARTPSLTAERLLLLVGMAAFLVIGLAVPHAFGQDAVAFGLGYLVVVGVHTWLYRLVNRNIMRAAPGNALSALLIIGAGFVKGAAAYALWMAADAMHVFTLLVVKPRGRFAIAPSHFAERHSALIIIVFGESVVDIGIGIGAAAHKITLSVAMSAALGLALTAALWWAYLGIGDDERAEEALAQAPGHDRPALVLAAYFYAYTPMVLGIVVLSAGVKRAIGHAGSTLPYPVCLALAGGAALFLAGNALFRHVLRIGALRYRVVPAAVALAVSAVGVTVSVAAEIALLTVVVAAALIIERRRAGPARVGTAQE